jgi:hypothetical protein
VEDFSCRIEVNVTEFLTIGKFSPKNMQGVFGKSPHIYSTNNYSHIDLIFQVFFIRIDIYR